MTPEVPDPLKSYSPHMNMETNEKQTPCSTAKQSTTDQISNQSQYLNTLIYYSL